MTLSAGTRLGAYEILAPIGAGGMGEVSRAADSRLSRNVAIKVASGRRQTRSGYAVSPDGARLFVLLLDRRAIPTQISVVLNWFEELKEKAGKP